MSLPVLADATGRARLDVTEHVRVPAHELRVDRARCLLEVALALLLEEQREEVDLEEEVAELVEQLVGPVGERRVRDLVRLLDRVRHDRPRRLLAVPGTVPAQAFRQLLQLEERVRERQAATARWRRGAGRGRRRRVADLVVRLRLEVLRGVVDPLPHLLLLLLPEELLLDRRLHLGQLRRRFFVLTGVSAWMTCQPYGRLDRLPELVGLEREGGLVELGHLPALRDRELAARVLRARVGRVLLRERREARAALELLVDLVGERLLLDEDVADVAALGLDVLRLVLLVVVRDVLCRRPGRRP